MRLLFVHAHFDDYEFTAAGTFELWRRRHPGVQRRLLVCTDGAAGHHELDREATAARRLAEQGAAAEQGGLEFRLLGDRAGQPFREARLHSSPDFLPALWREIREYEPDYLFCPPLPEDSLLGVHVDHLDVAQAVRAVAYMLNVPHAFSPEFGLSEGAAVAVRTPVVLHTYDGYMAGGQGHDLAVDIESVVDLAADLAWCHASQLQEWLPWVNRHHLHAAADAAAWRVQYRGILERRRAALGLTTPGLFEVFRVSAWGEVPTLEQLQRDFPLLSPGGSRLERLAARLSAWRRAAGSESVPAPAAGTPGGPTAASVPEPATGGDPATLRRRLEMLFGGTPGFNTGAKAAILAELLEEFGRPVLLDSLRREWICEFDTGVELSSSFGQRPAGGGRNDQERPCLPP